MLSFFDHVLTFWNSEFLGHMFQLGAPIAEKMLRPMIVYVALVLLLRVFGKRELAQLNPFDLVVLLSLSNTVQNAIIGEDNSVTGGLIGAFTLLGFNYIVVRFLFQHRRLDQLIQGSPTVLIRKGKLQPKGMARELLTEMELAAVAHRQGFAVLDEIETCIIEPGGTFFIEGREPPRHVVRHNEIIDRVEALSRQIEQIRRLLVEEKAAD